MLTFAATPLPGLFGPARPPAQPPLIETLLAPPPAPLPGILATIDFAEGGNGASHRIDGWSFQEPGFVWTTGATSTLRWPNISPCAQLVLEMDLLACLLPPYRTARRSRPSWTISPGPPTANTARRTAAF